MHLAVQNQTNPAKLFNTLPWAMAFKHAANEGYVVIAASNVIIKVVVDPATGLATVQNDPADPTRVLQLKVGKNPRGIVINSTDTRAYVMNYVSRDISVMNLVGTDQVLDTKLSANLPAAGTLADKIQVGKELYNTSVGEFDPAVAGGPPITGRMSRARLGRLRDLPSERIERRCRLDLPLRTETDDSATHGFRPVRPDEKHDAPAELFGRARRRRGLRIEHSGGLRRNRDDRAGRRRNAGWRTSSTCRLEPAEAEIN